VFGLSFATILTLIATPALLALPASLRDRWRARPGHVASPVQSDLGSPGADPAPSQ
jgi:multidrug efflux pump